MNERKVLRWMRDRQHVPEHELLSLLDGEQTPRQAARIRRHMERCWQCRARSEEMQAAITGFVAAREDALAAPENQPPGNWRLFDPLARQMEGEFARRRMGWSLPVLRSRGELTAGVVAALAIGSLLWYEFSSVGVVSASELLERAGRTEAVRVRHVSEPVVRQKVRVTRTSNRTATVASADLETWTDVASQRTECLGDQLLWRELQETLASGEWINRAPLSPAGFRSWWAGIQKASESVQTTVLADGRAGYVLWVVAAAPYSGNPIREARLLVSAVEWWPVELNLTVQADRELRQYQLVLKEYEVLSRSSVANLFATPPPVPKSVSRITERRAATVGIRTEIQPPTPESDPSTAEVNAHYALHRIGACLGEPIDITPAAGAVIVRALLDTEERKQQLLSVLREIPGVRLEARTVDEVRPTSPVDSEPSSSTVAAAIEVRVPVLPIEQRLARYFSNQQLPDGTAPRTVQLANEAVSASGDSVSHAWALQRLLQAFPPGRVARLHPPVSWLLEGMVRDHVSGIRKGVSRYRTTVEPVLVEVFGSVAESVDAPIQPPGRAALLGVFEQARDVDDTSPVCRRAAG